MTSKSPEAQPHFVVRAVCGCVDGARRNAWIVVALAAAISAALLTFTVLTLGINTDTSDMLSRDLPFRQNYEKYKAAFPYFSNTLVIVVDGENADLAEDAAIALEARLRENPQQFKNVFFPAGHPFFRTNGLLYLDTDELSALADRLAEAQPMLASLARDPSIRGLFGVLGLAVDEIRGGESAPGGLGDSFARISAVLEARADGGLRTLAWREMMAGEEMDPGDLRQIIVVQPTVDRGSLGHASKAMRTVRQYAQELGLDPAHGVRVRLTGSAALKTEELKSVSTGAGLAGLIALVLVSMLLAIGLRSWRLVVSVLVTLVVGLIGTAGFAAVAVGSLNLISVAFAVLFIGLGVDFGIHFSLRYKEEFSHDADHAAALRAAAAGVGGALALSAAAAAIAFFSFLPTAYKGVSELGLISGVGMFIALFANLTVLPAMLTVLPFRPSGRFRHRPLFSISVERSLRRHGRGIAVGALILGVAAAALLPRARFDYNPLNLQDTSTESVRTVRDLMQNSRASPYTISILTDDLDEAVALAEKISELDFVDRTMTLRDFVPRDQDEKLEIIDDMALFLTPIVEERSTDPAPEPHERRAIIDDFRGRLARLIDSGRAGALEPPARRLAAAIDRFLAVAWDDPAALAALETALTGTLPARLETLRQSLGAGPVEIEDLPEEIRRRQTAIDGRARIEVHPVEDLIENAALRRFVHDVRTLAPDATDNPVILLEAGDAVVGAFKKATGIALVAIIVLLSVLLRRAWHVVLVLAPLVLAASFTVAATVLLGLSFNFANIIVMPLLLGLGVASGIHIVTRARREQSATLLRTSTPRAIMFSALTTIGSFGSLSISSHRGTASMGELLTLALAFTLVCSLVVLPALMQVRRFGSAPVEP
jgi:hopanoid biosynthesis associated RND transporter like protein HpnN